ncbi:MAG: tRNA pseudouridine(55) synthase TruB [bacterium]|nr:tRNA pseudouridine(55) synthase TruB [bacterium]
MIIAVYKPKGPTSNDVVQMIKKTTGANKVGHAGTLDPLASGVLVVGIGRESTKNLSEEVKKEKEYIALVKLGETSETDDEEGKKTIVQKYEQPDKSIVTEITKKFIGRIRQIPPVYSAIKINGREAYKYARKGKAPEMKPREVEIKSIEILEYKWPFLKIKVTTGPGVYIRSLARDIGNELGTGGYLAELERTRVGQFTKDYSVKLKDIPKLFS